MVRKARKSLGTIVEYTITEEHVFFQAGVFGAKAITYALATAKREHPYGTVKITNLIEERPNAMPKEE